MLLAVAYLMLFFLGVMNITGVTLAEIAMDFEEEVHIVGYFFSLMSVGCLLALLYSPKLNKSLGVKKISVCACLVLFVGYIGMCYCEKYFLYAICMIIIGVGNGFLSFAANYIIINYCEGSERKVKLNRMHFFFSFGAIISPFAAGFAISSGMEWEWIYRLLTLVLLFLLYLVFKADFSVLAALKEKNIFNNSAGKTLDGKEVSKGWSFDKFIWMIGISFILYVFAENIFTNWFTVYLREKILVDVAVAGSVLSLFWLFMAVGRFFFSVVVRKLPLAVFVLGSGLLSCFSLVAVLFTNDISVIYFLTIVLGLSCSGIYASLLAYGTDMMISPPAEVVTFYIVCSSVGSIFSFFMAGFLKGILGISVTVFLGFASMFFLVILFILAIKNKKVLLLKRA